MLAGKAGWRCFLMVLTGMILISALPCHAQKQEKERRKKSEQAVSVIDQRPVFKVQGGVRNEVEPEEVLSDSMVLELTEALLDSLVASVADLGISRDSLFALGRKLHEEGAEKPDTTSDLLTKVLKADSLNAVYLTTHAKLHDTTDLVMAAPPQDTTVMAVRTDQKRVDRKGFELDSLGHRHSIVVKEGLVRDSIPLSKLALLSAVMPGYAQIYEGNYWKAAAGYVAMGVPLALSFKQTKEYKSYKREYDALVRAGAGRAEIDPVQTEMIRHNTYRQLLWAGTAISYMALLADGVYNYPSETSDVKKATTLSTLMPGTGQFYNQSYWRIPFVVGAFASIGYVIDWNNRGYQRFKLAYELVADENDATIDEFNGRYSASFLKNMKDQYRRNRDLAIILTAGVYLLNIIDAHVDAHLKDFDVSDDLSLNVSPEVKTFGTMNSGLNNAVGLNFNFTF